MCQCWTKSRDDLCLCLSLAARAELQALVIGRTPRKLVWRAEIVPATADGHGTFEIMRRAKTSKPTVWRWQERYLDAAVAGTAVASENAPEADRKDGAGEPA